MEWVIIFTTKEIFIQVNGKMEKSMEREKKNGKTAPVISDIINKAKKMVRESFNGSTVQNTLANSNRIL